MISATITSLETIMLDEVAKRALNERLASNPGDRERFISDSAQYLRDAGVSVLERAAGSDTRTGTRAPGPPVPVNIGR